MNVSGEYPNINKDITPSPQSSPSSSPKKGILGKTSNRSYYLEMLKNEEGKCQELLNEINDINKQIDILKGFPQSKSVTELKEEWLNKQGKLFQEIEIHQKFAKAYLKKMEEEAPRSQKKTRFSEEVTKYEGQVKSTVKLDGSYKSKKTTPEPEQSSSEQSEKEA